MPREELPKYKKWLRNIVPDLASLDPGRQPVRACPGFLRRRRLPSLNPFQYQMEQVREVTGA